MAGSGFAGTPFVMGLPLFVVVVVFCFLAGDANDKLTFICTYLNVKQFH